MPDIPASTALQLDGWKDLPFEIVLKIIKLLLGDGPVDEEIDDVWSLACTCRNLYHNIAHSDDVGKLVYRHRFDLGLVQRNLLLTHEEHLTQAELDRQDFDFVLCWERVQKWSGALKRGPWFYGAKASTRSYFDAVTDDRVFEVLVEMITYSYSGMQTFDEWHMLSKNVWELSRFIERHKLFDHVMDHRPGHHHIEGRVVRVLLTLSYAYIAHNNTQGMLGFPTSLLIVHAPRSTQPIVIRPEINKTPHCIQGKLLLHIVNYFAYHLNQPNEEGLLNFAYGLIPERLHPDVWQRPLDCWLDDFSGSFIQTFAITSPSEWKDWQRREDTDDIFSESNGESCKFHWLSIRTLTTEESACWPATFEAVTWALDHPFLPRIDPEKSRMFCGSFHRHLLAYPLKLHCVGWVTELPRQGGIPGWHRFSMVAFYRDEGDSPHDCEQEGLCKQACLRHFATTPEIQLLEDINHVYEGVVLPGDDMIVGRWMDGRHLLASQAMPQWSWKTSECQLEPRAPGEYVDQLSLSHSGPFMFWRNNDLRITEIPELEDHEQRVFER